MQALKWGPNAWDFLHTITFNYPQDPTEDNKQQYKQLFENLQYTLPCSHCRTSYSLILKYLNIDQYLDSREGLTFWLFIVHNLVNRKLKHELITFNNVVIKYENLRARCGNMNDAEQYNKCIKELVPITSSCIEQNLSLTYTKYKDIAKEQLKNFYESSNIIDPEFIK